MCQALQGKEARRESLRDQLLQEHVVLYLQELLASIVLTFYQYQQVVYVAFVWTSGEKGRTETKILSPMRACLSQKPSENRNKAGKATFLNSLLGKPQARRLPWSGRIKDEDWNWDNPFHISRDGWGTLFCPVQHWTAQTIVWHNGSPFGGGRGGSAVVCVFLTFCFSPVPLPALVCSSV